jgi:hypothetical protein
VTAPRHEGVAEATAAQQDEALRSWLLEVQTGIASAAPPRGLRRRVTLPIRAARRFRSLAAELGFSQAVAVSLEYAGRRFGRRP